MSGPTSPDEPTSPNKKTGGDGDGANDGAVIANDTHLRTLFEAAPFAIIEVAIDGRVLLWNKAAEEVYGWTAEEVIGQPVPFQGDTAESDRETVARLILDGQVVHDLVVERFHKDGSRVIVSGSAAPVRDDEGNIVSVIAIATDITEQQRMRQELLQAQRMEAVGRLAGGIAHDFNNLLTAILGNVEFLLEDVTDPGLREDLEAIRRAASRGSALTEQLLTVGRRQLLHLQLVDLNEVVMAMRPVLRRLLRDDVTLAVRTAPEVSTVRADPAQLEQVLLNLAVNARDAMPRGGKVFIDVVNVMLDAGGSAPLLDLEPGPYVQLTVRDTGEGMDSPTLERAFDPFFTTKPPGQGVGLGLAAVYGIVNQSGGRIGITSEPGVGTTFLIHLPRVSEEAGTPAEEPPPDAEPVAQTVLLVEDDRAVREVCRQVLQRAGYRVLEASNGLEALAIARSDAGESIHALVTDIVLPGMDGMQLATTLGNERESLHVLLISGYAERITTEGLPESVHADVLPKPFSPSELTRRVRAVIER